jgi:hypothetical protein
MATSGSPQAPSQPPPPLAAAAGGNRSSTYDDAISIAEQEVVIAEESGSSKRKKRTKGASSLTLPIYNLSDLVLLHITRFMKDISKKLLAVALTIVGQNSKIKL